MTSPIQEYLKRRPRYWRLWRVTPMSKVEPDWFKEDMEMLLQKEGLVGILASMVLNSMITQKQGLAIISSKDLRDLCGPDYKVNLLAKSRQGKSLYQALIFFLTEGVKVLKLLNQPTGREPGVYELVEPRYLTLVPPVTEEDRVIILGAAGVCRGVQGR